MIAVANTFLEELLFRGLFLGQLKDVFGSWGDIILASIVFTVMHSAASYLNLMEAMIFQVVLFPLTMLFAYLMHKTDNLWGATLFHAGMDVFMFYLLPL